MALVTAPLLEVDDIHLSFKGVHAIDGVSFEVGERELFAIIGPNGAGKTSIFNCLNQVYRPQRGEIRWRGESIMGKRPDEVAALGIARTFQNIELFAHMTVLENLMLGRHIRMQRGWLSGALWVGPAKKEELENRRKVEDIIDFLEIEQWRKYPVGLLPYGIQKRVELGRALAMDPQLLLLDEPVAGMSDQETEKTAALIRAIMGERTLMVVEHDMAFVRELGAKTTVLHEGSVLAEGSVEAVQSNPRVIEVYLGR
jgi:branched-chain amino acid transport system ATP-binding protein